MLRAILKKSWRQHPTKHQVYRHLPPITKTIQVRRTRHAGHCWRNRDELIRDVNLWTPWNGRAKAGRQFKPTHSSSARIRGVALRTCQIVWTIWRSGVRESRISVLVAWWYIYIYICVCVCVCIYVRVCVLLCVFVSACVCWSMDV